MLLGVPHPIVTRSTGVEAEVPDLRSVEAEAARKSATTHYGDAKKGSTLSRSAECLSATHCSQGVPEGG